MQKLETSIDYQVLVNQHHPITETYLYTLQLVNVVNFKGDICQVEINAYEAFVKLKADLLTKGVYIELDSTYRSVENQIALMDDFKRRYGLEYAQSVVAKPGTSEHHTGLAVDIVVKKDGIWVTDNADMLKMKSEFRIIHSVMPRYGFIVRYPKGKEQITGYGYEPWHLRYVGVYAAENISRLGCTLEECTSNTSFIIKNSDFPHQ